MFGTAKCVLFIQMCPVYPNVSCLSRCVLFIQVCPVYTVSVYPKVSCLSKCVLISGVSLIRGSAVYTFLYMYNNYYSNEVRHQSYSEFSHHLRDHGIG